MKRQVDITRANKDTILVQKCLYEIALLGLVILLLVFYDCGTFLLLLFYANYLRLKYILNDRHKKAWGKIDRWASEGLSDKPRWVQWGYAQVRRAGQWLIKFKGK